MMPPIPAIAFVGRSRSGKTTLLEKLIRELTRRGYRVAAVKHTAHPIEPDVPGKDTYRLAQAGAAPVILAAPEAALEEVLAGVRDVDLVLVEGYKRADVPKIEVYWSGEAGSRRQEAGGKGQEAGGRRQETGGRRQETGGRRQETGGLVCLGDERLIAVVSDRRFEVDVPQFGLEDVVALADWIEAQFLQPTPAPAAAAGCCRRR